VSRPDADADADADAGTGRDAEDPGSQFGTDPTVISRTIARTVVPIVLLTAVALLLQGHNLPGGGFIAGVLTTTAFALIYIVYGREYLQRQLLATVDPADEDDDDPLLGGAVGEYGRAFTVGLALAAGAGLGAIALGGNFLAQGVVFLEPVPLYGEIEIASALAFDLGVYFVVVGALLTILAVVGAE
jgi:multicomponent Na+:H+ antiporter subunit B